MHRKSPRFKDTGDDTPGPGTYDSMSSLNPGESNTQLMRKSSTLSSFGSDNSNRKISTLEVSNIAMKARKRSSFKGSLRMSASEKDLHQEVIHLLMMLDDKEQDLQIACSYGESLVVKTDEIQAQLDNTLDMLEMAQKEKEESDMQRDKVNRDYEVLKQEMIDLREELDEEKNMSMKLQSSMRVMNKTIREGSKDIMDEDSDDDEMQAHIERISQLSRDLRNIKEESSFRLQTIEELEQERCDHTLEIDGLKAQVALGANARAGLEKELAALRAELASNTHEVRLLRHSSIGPKESLRFDRLKDNTESYIKDPSGSRDQTPAQTPRAKRDQMIRCDSEVSYTGSAVEDTPTQQSMNTVAPIPEAGVKEGFVDFNAISRQKKAPGGMRMAFRKGGKQRRQSSGGNAGSNRTQQLDKVVQGLCVWSEHAERFLKERAFVKWRQAAVGEQGVSMGPDLFYLIAAGVRLSNPHLTAFVHPSIMWSKVQEQKIPFHEWHNFVRAELTRADLFEGMQMETDSQADNVKGKANKFTWSAIQARIHAAIREARQASDGPDAATLQADLQTSVGGARTHPVHRDTMIRPARRGTEE